MLPGEISLRQSVLTAKCPTTKCHTAKNPTAKCPVTCVAPEKRCPDTNDFLANVANKTSLISILGKLMDRDGRKVVYCKGDADTIIVKQALETDGETVVVIADDTYVFYLLIHRAKEYEEKKNIYLSSMKSCVRTGEQTANNIRTVIS